MEISETYLKSENKKVTVYEYNADDEEPDCMKCVHVCDSREICDKCGSSWLNYKRIFVEDAE